MEEGQGRNMDQMATGRKECFFFFWKCLDELVSWRVGEVEVEVEDDIASIDLSSSDIPILCAVKRYFVFIFLVVTASCTCR